MKLNKREQLAFNCLQKILNAFKSDKVLEVPAVEINAVREVFGIDLRKITYKKSQIAEFKRGKDKPHMILKKQANIEPFPYGYFPFQVKEDKVKERAKEVEELKRQEIENKRKEQERQKVNRYYPFIKYVKQAMKRGAISDWDLYRMKDILLTNLDDCFDLTNEERTDLLELIIEVEKTL